MNLRILAPYQILESVKAVALELCRVQTFSKAGNTTRPAHCPQPFTTLVWAPSSGRFHSGLVGDTGSISAFSGVFLQ